MQSFDQLRVRRYLTIFGVTALLLLGVRYAIEARYALLCLDVGISLIGLWAFVKFFDRMHQDNLSYGAFLALLLFHASYLYELHPLGIAWDHYMHFIGGFAIVLCADRLFKPDHWGNLERFTIVLIFALGIGAIHEIIEWLGYGFLGRGEGFLLFGAGDEGAWRNSILDMIFNFFGGFTAAVGCYLRRDTDKIASKK